MMEKLCALNFSDSFISRPSSFHTTAAPASVTKFLWEVWMEWCWWVGYSHSQLFPGLSSFAPRHPCLVECRQSCWSDQLGQSSFYVVKSPRSMKGLKVQTWSLWDPSLRLAGWIQSWNSRSVNYNSTKMYKKLEKNKVTSFRKVGNIRNWKHKSLKYLENVSHNENQSC